ncbi:hypothetical protein IFM89_008141 [Coptis chinensis]|uniref:Piwi domain-containing protein n=1 Tax=Coptis chinensis TaxID=261450 RepID=A0A835M946_9MAGN|nr:hypothetical protein IFM89_008141 [Coptis chinensis]
MASSFEYSYIVVGSSFFSPKLGQKSDIGDGLECWKGFYQSLRLTQMGLSLNTGIISPRLYVSLFYYNLDADLLYDLIRQNCTLLSIFDDVTTATFYGASPIVEFARSVLNIRDTSRPLSDSDCTKLKKALIGLTVELTHLRNAPHHRIKRITTHPTSHLMFSIGGMKLSVAEYFRNKHRIRLEYAHWPSLNAGSDVKPTYLPMEVLFLFMVCKIVEGQKYSKKLNDKQITARLRAACQCPTQMEDNLWSMVQNNNYITDRFAQEFGIQVKTNFASIQEARVLRAPVKMVNGGNIKYWMGISFSSELSLGAATSFCNELDDMCRSKGMNFESRPFFPVMLASPDQIKETLVNIHKQSTKVLSSKGNRAQLQLVIIVLPDAAGKIKRICEIELGLVSQRCQAKHAMRPKKQYLENVSLKINVKAGGRNTVLFAALTKEISLVSDKPTIIFGGDVTHPGPGEDSNPSLTAVVASMDWPEVTKYQALVSAQPRREEMMQDLHNEIQDPKKGTYAAGMIRTHLISFKNSTGQKPERIIFYRDGVSEGQFRQVLLHELVAIRKACSSLEHGYQPPATFVVVQKRHHTRLLPANHTNRNLTDKSGNILPGTVVDTMICHPTQFDFYLCSHAGIHGTSRPAHYHVLWDENGFTSDSLQTLTNNLCYTYARCTRSTSIVWKEFVWGGAAGAFGEGMMHPIDTIKTRIQSQAIVNASQAQKSIPQMVRTVWAADGIRGQAFTLNDLLTYEEYHYVPSSIHSPLE